MEQVVLTNMCMVTDEQGKVLVQMHGGNWKGWCFPGGHVEEKESFVKSVIREVYEESGITVETPEICGVKQFFMENGFRYIVLLFRTNRFTGSLKSSSEGEVRWMTLEELSKQPMAPSFDELLPMFLDDSKQELFYDFETGITYL